ncbi:MAG: YeeE/YedE family protein [Alphaproteobacteria bacterium]|nr:YeeE/YedE family protein [Alphaproteobacteria bacterium]|tara:strand:- start:299 stop:733 length:435 start_codon:yes stop_codon:yes gene_type:complete
MTIDFASFTPMASLVGGVMIGVAALLLMLLHGRVMGISGILGGIVRPAARDDVPWRLLFVAGALLGPLAVIYLVGRPVEVVPVASGLVLPVAGFLVGLGTAIGSGCTSGHGICGLARLSMRSAAAVGMFMITAVVTVYIVRHVV